MELPEAKRCVVACAKYFREHDESPRAAKDLEEAVKVIEENARLRGATGIPNAYDQLNRRPRKMRR